MPADVEIRIDASNRGALSALRSTKTELGAVERQAKHTGAGFRGAERDLGRVSRGALAGSGVFRHLGRSVAFASGAFLGATGFVGAVRASITAAGDLNTQIARSEIVFGKHANAVQEWSRSTNRHLNLARTTALETANAFGTVFSGAGLDAGQAARFSQRLTRVVAAISLARGEADPANAQQAALVALTGRGRALRQYGIIVDQTAIKEEAARLGLAKATVDSRKVTEARQRLAIATAQYNDALARHGPSSTQAAGAALAVQRAQDALTKAQKGGATQLTRQQTAIAATNIILRQGTKYTSDYAKMQNTAAGRSRAFHQGTKELQEELGTQLLPTFNRTLDAVNKYLGSLGEGGSRHAKFVHVVGQVRAALEQAWGAAKLVARGLNLAAHAIGGWSTAFKIIITAFLANKFLNLVDAIRKSRIAMVTFGRTSETQLATATTATGRLGNALRGLPAKITIGILLVPQVYGPMKKFFEQHFGADYSGLDASGDTHPTAAPTNTRQGRATNVAQSERAQGKSDMQIRSDLLQRGFTMKEANKALRQTRPGARYGAAPRGASGVVGTARQASQQPNAGSVGFHLPGERTPYDCSAFTQAVFRQNGISIGSTTYTQQHNGVGVKPSEIQPGDLLFFTYPGERKPGHVGIYMGGGMMVHDHGASGGVSYQPVDWSHFNFARRVTKAGGQTKGTDLGGSGSAPPGGTSGTAGGVGTGLHVDHSKKPKTPRYADPETIKLEDRRIREEEAAVRRARRRGEITPQQAANDLRRLEALRKQLHQAHLKPAEERDIQDRVSRLWRGINKTIQAGVARARKHAAELAKAHAKAVSDAEKVVNRARDKLGQAWDRLVSRSDEAFDRVTQAGVDAISRRYDAPTPAEAALQALQNRRSALDNANTLSDAQGQLALAQRLGDPQMIKEAQRAVDAAQLDAQEAGLQKQADAERAAADARKDREIQDYEDMRAIQRDKMDDFLADLKTKLDDGTITWKDALAEVKALLSDPNNLGDFGSLGALIGGTFVQGLLDAIAGTGGAADAVDAALKKLRKLGYVWNPATGDFEKVPAGSGRPGAGAGGGDTGIHHDPGHGAAKGALITRPMLVRAGENFRKEAFIPLEDPRALAAVRDALGGGGGTVVNVYVQGSVTAERDLAETIRSEFLKTQKRNGGRLGLKGR